MTTRRQFMRTSAAGATALWATDLSLPGFLSRTVRACTPARGERILVVVQLTGGNDGLNTVVPFGQDAYYRLRPTLGIGADRLHRLTDELGLHPEMAGFARLHGEGRLGVVMNVGYPNPDRSHFRSLDIWQTARMEPDGVTQGWLGRTAARLEREGDDPDVPAMHIGNGPLPLALRSGDVAVPSLDRLDALRLPEDVRNLQHAIAAARPQAGDDLLFVQRVAVSACETARRLERLDSAGATRGYPNYGLAQRLRGIADLVSAQMGARIYYTSLGGFDTHARQADTHGVLLRELSDSVTAFFDDLESRGLADQVLLVTFSEFGRRTAENGSRGTDHGAAAPIFIAGPACRAGISGHAPDLDDLVQGDVRHAVDFRGVYATLLDRWLGVDSAAILGRSHAPVPLLA